MVKLDFKRFKKISSDKDKTVMQHEQGHTITIAHKALTPKVREQLMSLPAAAHKDGGEIRQSNPKLEESKKLPHLFGGARVKGTDLYGSTTAGTSADISPSEPPKVDVNTAPATGPKDQYGYPTSVNKAKGGRVERYDSGGAVLSGGKVQDNASAQGGANGSTLGEGTAAPAASTASNAGANTNQSATLPGMADGGEIDDEPMSSYNPIDTLTDAAKYAGNAINQNAQADTDLYKSDPQAWAQKTGMNTALGTIGKAPLESESSLPFHKRDLGPSQPRSPTVGEAVEKGVISPQQRNANIALKRAPQTYADGGDIDDGNDADFHHKAIAFHLNAAMQKAKSSKKQSPSVGDAIERGPIDAVQYRGNVATNRKPQKFANGGRAQDYVDYVGGADNTGDDQSVDQTSVSPEDRITAPIVQPSGPGGKPPSPIQQDAPLAGASPTPLDISSAEGDPNATDDPLQATAKTPQQQQVDQQQAALNTINAQDQQRQQAAQTPVQQQAQQHAQSQADANTIQAQNQQQQQAAAVDPKQQEVVKMQAENVAWQHDLANGHITPETYKDLFAKKDTLGKIGSIFGMVLAGMGSGLTHQPNSLLQLMNNEIDRDLEAQKQSKSNALNFLNHEQNVAMNEARQKQMAAGNVLTGQQANLIGKQAQTIGLANAKVKMLQTGFHDLVQNTQKDQGTPQGDLSNAVLGQVYNKMGDQINSIIDQGAGAKAQIQMMMGNQINGQPVGDEQAFQKRMMGLKMMGPQGGAMAKDQEAKHIPGFIGQASEDMTPTTKNELKGMANYDQQIGRFRDWAQQHSGVLPTSPQNLAIINQGKTLAKNLQSAYRENALNTVYRPGEQGLLSQTIPDDPTQFLNKWRVLPQLDALRQENMSKLNGAAKLEGFQGYQPQNAPQSGQQQNANPNEGKTGTMPNGQRVIMKNGKLVPLND